MRGQDWTNQRGVEPGAKLSRLNAGGDHATDRKSKRTAARRRARQHMRSIASDMVSIFRDISEMREIAEGSYDARGLHGWQLVQRVLKFASRCFISIAVEAHRIDANTFDEIKDVRALLVTNSIAEQPSQHANVFT